MDGSQPLKFEYDRGIPAGAANDSGNGPDVRAARIETARLALRRHTREEHKATEAAFARFDIARADHYRAFLTAHAMALPRLERGLTCLGWRDWQPRFPCLADDLAALGASLPAPMIAPRISPTAAWGVQYVLEGSRLGGKPLSQRVGADMPRRYLAPRSDIAARWQAFCAAIDHAIGMEMLDEVLDSAIETFRSFRHCAETMSEYLR